MAAEPPSPSQTLHVTTLNCWGLKYISKYRRERLFEIGSRLASSSPIPNIVGLQECWTSEDYRQIRKLTKRTLPHGKFYHSGIFGGGLAILSKWPIEESNMVRYPLNGRPTAFFRGDWFVGKGIACAKIRFGKGRKDVVEVFCTHLHAPYEREPNDSYLCHRTAQAWEIARLMSDAVEKGHYALGLGDFNMIPDSLACRIVTTHGRVRDTWRVLHPESSLSSAVDAPEKDRGKAMPTAAFNVTENGTTCDSVLNSWRWREEDRARIARGENVKIDDSTADPNGKRLDYIFFGAEQHAGLDCWEVKETRVGFTERHAALGCSLSDHFSVEVTIRIKSHDKALIANGNTASSTTTTKTPSDDERRPTLVSQENAPLFPPSSSPRKQHVSPLLLLKKPDETENVHSSKKELPSQHAITSPEIEHLPPSTYREILHMISIYTLRERRQRRWRMAHFLASVPVSIGCLVTVFWSPHNYVSFVLMLLSTLGLGTGVVDGLIGGLFVGSELRALKEFEWEVRNALKASGGEGQEEVEERSLRDWWD